MKIESINQTIRERPNYTFTGIAVEGSFIIVRYTPLIAHSTHAIGFVSDWADIQVYYNDQGREVFIVTLDPPPIPKLSLWRRFINRINKEWAMLPEQEN